MKRPTIKPKDVPLVDTDSVKHDGESRSHEEDAEILTGGHIDTANLASRDDMLHPTVNQDRETDPQPPDDRLCRISPNPVGEGVRPDHVPPDEILLSDIEKNMIAETPVYYHDGGPLYAGDVEKHMAVLPKLET